MMRPDEKFVLNALVSQFGGCFTEGQNPPDAYLMIDNRRIAVEVTRLIEQLVSEDGTSRSRFADDMPAVNLANELDEHMRNQIPDSKFVFLVLSTPIKNIRRTKDTLIHAILDKIQMNSEESDFVIEGNVISIYIYEGEKPSGKKIATAVANRYSSANIGDNTRSLLEDRISTKSKVRIANEGIDEHWLALLNDYWVADEESWRSAYNLIEVEHRFNKILVVDGNGGAHQLC